MNIIIPGQVNHTGRWLARLLHDHSIPARGVPTHRSLVWNTRRVRQEQVDHYWSEPSRAGVVPCVEAWLMRIDVTRRIGSPITLWRTEADVQIFVPTLPGRGAAATPVATFSRARSFADADAARAEFAAYEFARVALAGESRPRASVDYRIPGGTA